jgi:hypothetical protein
MNKTDKAISALILAVVLLAGAAVGMFVTLGHIPAHDGTAFSAPVDQVYLDNTPDFGTASMVTAGPLADTLLVATNTGRLYLEISNESTSSPGQALYCNTNDRPATIGKGLVVFASSTRIFKDLLGSIRCRYASASSGVAFFEK